MLEDQETTWLAFLIVALAGVPAAFLYLWYRRSYRPGTAAGRLLTNLALSLRKNGPTWIQTSDVSIRGLSTALLPIYTNDEVDISIEGHWKDAPVTIQFRLAVGMPETGFWGRLNGVGDPGVYYPPMTSLRLTSKHHLAKRAGLIKTSKIDNDVNNVLAGIGLAGKYTQVSEDLFAYGEELEIASFFNSAVLAHLRSFPKNLFVHPFDGPVIEGTEIRLSWEGHETDPKVIEAAFILIEAVSKSGATAR